VCVSRIEYELKAETNKTGSGQISYATPCVAMFVSTWKYEWSCKTFVPLRATLRIYERKDYLFECARVVAMCWTNVVTFEPVRRVLGGQTKLIYFPGFPITLRTRF